MSVHSFADDRRRATGQPTAAEPARLVPASDQPEPPLSGIAVRTEPRSPSDRCQDVHAAFESDPDLLAIPILDEGRVVGVVNRNDFLQHLSRRYGWALYARKPVSTVMERDPLVVDVGDPLEELVRTLTNDRPGALYSGFVLTREGAYFGVATALSVLRGFAAENERKSEEARRANEEKSRFLAMMSHEIRTPLNAVIAFSDIIRTRALGEDAAAEEVYRKNLDIIYNSGVYMSDIVSNVLDLSRIQSGALSLELELTEVADVLRSALETMGPIARRKSVSIRLFCEDCPRLRMDRRAMSQVLMNVLSNAVKFSAEQSAVEISSRNAGARIEIEILDAGPGFKATATPADRAIKSQKGAGIGLQLCREILRLHNGGFATSDRPEGGARVVISLPKETIPTSLALISI